MSTGKLYLIRHCIIHFIREEVQPEHHVRYSASQKIPPPAQSAVFWHFSQTVENFKSIFTRLLYVSIYSRLQIFIQLSPTSRIPWILLIRFGYIEVDFVVGEWISWISLFR